MTLSQIQPYWRLVGKIFGTSPLTICLGAQRYIGVDPYFEPVAINLDKTSTEFLTKAFKETERILSGAKLTAVQSQPLKNKIEIEEFLKNLHLLAQNRPDPVRFQN